VRGRPRLAAGPALGETGQTVPDDLQIPLAAAIRALRSELLEAVRAGEDDEIRFALGPIELELTVEATRERGGDAGVRFSLLSAGARSTRASGSTQVVRLTLTPVRAGADGEDRDVLVASELEPRD
jgi:Trypsin-co-occurring domain 2